MAWNDPGDWTLSVSDLNEYVRKSLSADPMLRSLKLRGEISGLKRHSSGHMYFTLKDEGARIAAVMFRQQAQGLDFRPADGMRVVAHGSVSLYAAAGQYQFYAESMRPDGQGDLFLRFEQLKDKLLREGLFDQSLKQPLPMRARSVGIVTSPTGAVVHDIQTVAARRDPTVKLTLCPVNVQGAAAAGEIARALMRMDKQGFDVLIVGRGGGSLEDLWAFNEEIVARAIAACKTPVISAVGHEVDFTIADFAADVRAATPSVAAELAIADRAELMRMLDERRMRLDRAMSGAIERAQARLERASARLEAQGPRGQLELIRVKLDAMDERLHAARARFMDGAQARVRELSGALARLSPAPDVTRRLRDVGLLSERLHAAAVRGLDERARHVDALGGRLDALDPEAVVARGYAIVTVGGRALSDAGSVSPGDMLDVRMRGGTVSALAISIDESAEVSDGKGTEAPRV